MPAAAYAHHLQYFDPSYVTSSPRKDVRRTPKVETSPQRARDLLLVASVILRDEGHERVSFEQIVSCLRSLEVDLPHDVSLEALATAIGAQIGFQQVGNAEYELG
jgi:hypothetical protein